MSGILMRKYSVSRSQLITDTLRQNATTTTTTTKHFCRSNNFSKKTGDTNGSNSSSSSYPSFLTFLYSSFPPPPPSYSYSKSSSSKAGLVGWYMEMLKSRPVLTKSLTSSFIYVAADLSSQSIARSDSEPYDLARTLRMGGYGMLVLGPSLHFWFNFMSKLFPKRDLLTTFKKIVLGQTTYGPVMTVVFFSLNARLRGENADEIVARLKRDLLPTLRNGVMYWPMCDFITFKFIPVQLQPLVSNSFSYLWTVYMTYMASLDRVDSSC